MVGSAVALCSSPTSRLSMSAAGPCLLELFSSILSFSDHVMVLTMMGPLMDSAVILASIVVEVASD
ncbi:hypothetical protein SETIT_3G206700v2 [Setaria italica]|uniref:Uncharacterized protein n=1 Tax=Setaria italica TaxID=4555 RepID=A0A368QJ12_SETIT|nr:hypothetical protein SETIT_3G206700v2 [Setaria italica]RCV17270.1 hypothetical protein SETIT_3G206700v2 [Setaria italica]